MHNRAHGAVHWVVVRPGDDMSWQTIGLVVLVGLNIFATVRIFPSDLLAPQQRALQILVVWLIPVVGAIVCLVVSASHAPDRDKTRDPRFNPIEAEWDVVPRQPGSGTEIDDA